MLLCLPLTRYQYSVMAQPRWLLRRVWAPGSGGGVVGRGSSAGSCHPSHCGLKPFPQSQALNMYYFWDLANLSTRLVYGGHPDNLPARRAKHKASPPRSCSDRATRSVAATREGYATQAPRPRLYKTLSPMPNAPEPTQHQPAYLGICFLDLVTPKRLLLAPIKPMSKLAIMKAAEILPNMAPTPLNPIHRSKRFYSQYRAREDASPVPDPPHRAADQQLVSPFTRDIGIRAPWTAGKGRAVAAVVTREYLEAAFMIAAKLMGLIGAEGLP
jgi:hypothetical protein